MTLAVRVGTALRAYDLHNALDLFKLPPDLEEKRWWAVQILFGVYNEYLT